MACIRDPFPTQDNARLFNQLIRPTLTGTPSENPTVLFTAGQPGAGKTTVQRTLLARLGRTDAFPLDGDDLVALHPGYDRFHRENDFTGAFMAAEDLKGHWWSRAARLLRIQRLDISVSAPLAGPDWAIARFEDFRRASYTVGVAFVATHEALSLQGIVDRYHRDRRSVIGYGRWIPPQWHDAAYPGVLETADRIDALQAADSIYVIRRDGVLLHVNHLEAGGEWALGAATRQVVEAERARPWTLQESAQFLQKQGRLRQELSAEWTPVLDSIDRRSIPVIAALTVHDDAQLDARRAEAASLLQKAEREAEAVKDLSEQLADAHRNGANALRLEELRATVSADQLRSIRDSMHQERWNTNITKFGLTRQVAAVRQLMEGIGQEQQRRTVLDPEGRRREERARQHLQALASQTAELPQPRTESPVRRGPERQGPRQAL